MALRKNTAAVATYGDHEVITPENTLRKALTNRPASPDESDPVSRAERALAELADNFGSWMDEECARLAHARHAVDKGGFTQPNRDALFHAAHDIKGEAGTFGYPAVATAADSLCRLIELSPDARRIPIKLVDQHVDAVRAIYREYANSDARSLADRLTTRLREVTDEFLRHENRDRPEVLAQITGPGLVPEQNGP